MVLHKFIIIMHSCITLSQRNFIFGTASIIKCSIQSFSLLPKYLSQKRICSILYIKWVDVSIPLLRLNLPVYKNRGHETNKTRPVLQAHTCISSAPAVFTISKMELKAASHFHGFLVCFIIFKFCLGNSICHLFLVTICFIISLFGMLSIVPCPGRYDTA
jgi:hypothetical protein